MFIELIVFAPKFFVNYFFIMYIKKAAFYFQMNLFVDVGSSRSVQYFSHGNEFHDTALN